MIQNNRFKYISQLFTVALLLFTMTGAVKTQSLDQTEYLDDSLVLVMETTKGTVFIQLKPELAPKHVEQVLKLTKDKFYDGIIFHRVIEDFMAQTGDPTGTGSGGSSLPDIPAEFSDHASFERGTVGMARTSDPDSANSQFFINFVNTPWLDGKYTIFGEVISGIEVVDSLNKGQPPENPDRIISMRIASDMNKPESP